MSYIGRFKLDMVAKLGLRAFVTRGEHFELRFHTTIRIAAKLSISTVFTMSTFSMQTQAPERFDGSGDFEDWATRLLSYLPLSNANCRNTSLKTPYIAPFHDSRRLR